MIERKNEERGNFLTFYDRGIKTCLKKKRMLSFIIQLYQNIH